MNNDLVQEILFHLPVQSLLRFRAVSKSWRDIIDSPFFRKLLTQNNDYNNNNGMVCLQFEFLRCDKQHHCKLSIKLLDNGKSFTLPHNLNGHFPYNKYVRFVGPVKGLICIYSEEFNVPAIAICNPFLGQLKILPQSPFPQCQGPLTDRQVGIGNGCDGDHYKVVELVFCREHGHNHARVYSDSWRDLVLDQWNNLRIIKPVKSSSKNGYFAHWLTSGFVLTFDMRNEVFRAIKTVNSPWTYPVGNIFAMDSEGEESFVMFRDDGRNGPVVEIYEQRSGCKYWKAMVKLKDH